MTKRTFDAYLYQTIENKQKFISQVFTSKSPARAMQDVDEAVLNYAEVKALATGDERIMELCTLEAEVGKLRMLKSSFLSQRYDLEDRLRQEYPREIARYEKQVRGYGADIALRDANAPADPEAFAMTVEEQEFSSPKAAGSALLEACKAYAGKEPKPIGIYRGFAMEIQFNSHEKDYRLTLRGAIEHFTALGGDVRGNITRIDNLLDGMEDNLRRCETHLAETRDKAERAAAEVAAPFEREAELSEKSARLGALKTELQVDEPEPVLIADDTPDEGDMTVGARKKDARER